METLSLIWRNETVGRLEQYRPDMWYLEARFVPASSEVAQDFSRRARALDAKAAFTDWTRGIRAAITSASTDEERTTVIILSLADDQLLLRRVMEKESVAWAEANVPEIPADNQPLQRTPAAVEPSWFQRLFGRGPGR